MNNYLTKIESELGNWRELPENPFKKRLHYAVFSSLNDQLIDQALYEAIFQLNENNGNNRLIFKSFLDVVGRIPNLLIQRNKRWEEVESFQDSSLVNEGFYITGEKLNWLGIYHPDNYFVLGTSQNGLEDVCKHVYGHVDWVQEFINQYETGKLEIYQQDFEELKRHLL
ncbi:hypothetical protein [Pseudidiomarina sp. YC-516-91]|uniref:hypothetical protein n=1 Tax=Pseudidiomarina salilacus TaxID=3384452 RepID=UPI0039853609